MLTRGVYPAAVTPFETKGSPDPLSMAKLLAWFESNGCQGAVLAGTNGEGPSLSAPEKRNLLQAANRGKGRLTLVLGIATSSLDEAKWLCRQAAAEEAAVLLMPPYYFREADQSAVSDWLAAVVESSTAPVVVYNFPQRTGVSLEPETLHRLSALESFAGVKDSSGAEANLVPYRQAIAERHLAFVGDETLLVRALQAGWSGTISGAANVLAGWLSQIVAEWPTDRESAETKFEILLPCITALRGKRQPATSKGLLKALGVLPADDVRLPLRPCDPQDVWDVADQVQTRLGLRFPNLPVRP